MRYVIIGILFGFMTTSAFFLYRLEKRVECSATGRGCPTVVRYDPVPDGDLVLTSVVTNRTFTTPTPNAVVDRTVVVRTVETYSPVVVEGHWVVDGRGNRVRYVETHIEYK